MTLTGTMRCDVALGMVRLAIMFAASRRAGPRMGTSSSPLVGWWAGAGVAVRDPLPVAAVFVPLESKIFFQLSSTVERSWRYCWYSSSSSQSLMPRLAWGVFSDMETAEGSCSYFSRVRREGCIGGVGGWDKLMNLFSSLRTG